MTSNEGIAAAILLIGPPEWGAFRDQLRNQPEPIGSSNVVFISFDMLVASLEQLKSTYDLVIVAWPDPKGLPKEWQHAVKLLHDSVKNKTTTVRILYKNENQRESIDNSIGPSALVHLSRAPSEWDQLLEYVRLVLPNPIDRTPTPVASIADRQQGLEGQAHAPEELSRHFIELASLWVFQLFDPNDRSSETHQFASDPGNHFQFLKLTIDDAKHSFEEVADLSMWTRLAFATLCKKKNKKATSERQLFDPWTLHSSYIEEFCDHRQANPNVSCDGAVFVHPGLLLASLLLLFDKCLESFTFGTDRSFCTLYESSTATETWFCLETDSPSDVVVSVGDKRTDLLEFFASQNWLQSSLPAGRIGLRWKGISAKSGVLEFSKPPLL